MRFILILIVVSILSCKTEPGPESKPNADAGSRTLSEAFKDYWYNGEAELNSYGLEYYRYGEKRIGTAMLIFVTEDFLQDEQVKASSKSSNAVSVMKLNSTKNFNTGIYPYSIMQSAFLPLTQKQPLIKASSSTQEWCGQMYAQLNHRDQFKIKTYSYFQGEADRSYSLEPTLTEHELWIQLRIDPHQLELGQHQVLPSLNYLQLNHRDYKTYSATLDQRETDFIITSLTYAHLGRILKIYQTKEFPFEVQKWEEIEISSKDTLVSKAVKNKTLRTKYWQKNSNNYLHLRDSLSL